MNLVLIVEGFGDVEAFPEMVGKIGAWLESPIYTTQPIRSGGWTKLKRAGGLEKYVGLAASRPNCDRIVIVVDLDDGCPVIERESVIDRLASLSAQLNIEIELCFCVREFEAWLLHVVDRLCVSAPEYGWMSQVPPGSPEDFRDAKGRLRDLVSESYGERPDQAVLAKRIAPSDLYSRCRSYRKFVKAVSGVDYDLLATL